MFSPCVARPVAHVHAFGQSLQDPDHLLHRPRSNLEVGKDGRPGLVMTVCYRKWPIFCWFKEFKFKMVIFQLNSLFTGGWIDILRFTSYIQRYVICGFMMVYVASVSIIFSPSFVRMTSKFRGLRVKIFGIIWQCLCGVQGVCERSGCPEIIAMWWKKTKFSQDICCGFVWGWSLYRDGDISWGFINDQRWWSREIQRWMMNLEWFTVWGCQSGCYFFLHMILGYKKLGRCTSDIFKKDRHLHLQEIIIWKYGNKQMDRNQTWRWIPIRKWLITIWNNRVSMQGIPYTRLLEYWMMFRRSSSASTAAGVSALASPGMAGRLTLKPKLCNIQFFSASLQCSKMVLGTS